MLNDKGIHSLCRASKKTKREQTRYIYGNLIKHYVAMLELKRK